MAFRSAIMSSFMSDFRISILCTPFGFAGAALAAMGQLRAASGAKCSALRLLLSLASDATFSPWSGDLLPPR